MNFLYKISFGRLISYFSNFLRRYMKTKNVVLGIIIILAIVVMICLSCNTEEEFHLNEKLLNNIALSQNLDGSIDELITMPVNDKEILSIYKNISDAQKDTLFRDKSRTYLYKILENEMDWEHIEWVKKDTFDLPTEIPVHYFHLSRSLSVLLSIDPDVLTFRKAIEKLISEQKGNGSWYDIFAITADNMSILSKYYYLTNNSSMVSCIKKANDWLIETINAVKNETSKLLLYNFYCNIILDMPPFIKESIHTEEVINKIIAEYYKEPAEEEKFVKNMKTKMAYNLIVNNLLPYDEKVKNSNQFYDFFTLKLQNPEADNYDISAAIKYLQAAQEYLSDNERAEVNNLVNNSIKFLLKIQTDDGVFPPSRSLAVNIGQRIANTTNSLYALLRAENRLNSTYFNNIESGVSYLNNFYSDSLIANRNVDEKLLYANTLFLDILCDLYGLTKDEKYLTPCEDFNSYIKENISNVNLETYELPYLASMVYTIAKLDEVLTLDAEMTGRLKRLCTLLVSNQNEDGSWVWRVDMGNEEIMEVDLTATVYKALDKADKLLASNYSNSLKKALDYCLAIIPLDTLLDTFLSRQYGNIGPYDRLTSTYILLNNQKEHLDEEYKPYKMKFKKWLEIILDKEKDNIANSSLILYGLLYRY